MTPPLLLAQPAARLQRDARRATDEATRWLTEDPTGQVVGVAGVVVVTAIALFVFFRSFRWAAARWKTFVGLAAALALGYLGVVYVLNLGPIGWLVAGVVALSMFLGFALFSTQSGSRR